MEDIIEYLKTHPFEREIILLELLKDDTISIAKLVELKETSMRTVLSRNKEEIANGYALILRYREGLNKKTINEDADRFLSESSYTGLGKYEPREK